MEAVRTVGRVAWSAGAAFLLGLAVAWLATGLAVSDAYAAQKTIDFQRGGPPSDFGWGALTSDPYVQGLFFRVWAAASGGLFLAFTIRLWDGMRPAARPLPVGPRPPDAEVRPKAVAAEAPAEGTAPPSATRPPSRPKPRDAKTRTR